MGVDAEGDVAFLNGDVGSDAAAATGELSKWHGSREPGTCPPGRTGNAGKLVGIAQDFLFPTPV